MKPEITNNRYRRCLARLVLLWARLRGDRRIRHNQCPACNSDAPAVDSCPVCESYDARNQWDVYPPEGWRKMDWRKRYGSYVEYLYVENPPKLEWDGERWIEKQNKQLSNTHHLHKHE
jgi:hypothetical protein